MQAQRRPRPPSGALLLTIAGCLLAGAARGDDGLLGKPINAVGDGVELAVRLSGVRRAGLAEVLLDRRVDPHTPLARAEAGPLGESLNAALRPRQLGVTELGGTLYVGPEQAVRNLRTIAELARQQTTGLDPRGRAAMNRVDSLSWPQLADPRDLIAKLLAAHGLRLANPERLPHDVWAAGRLPAMPLSDRLTLLLIGFDVVWRPASTAGDIELVAAPTRPVLTRRHTRLGGWGESEFREEFPEAKLRRVGQRWELTARLEAHEAIARGPRPRAGQAAGKSPLESQRLTLTVKRQPAGAVLAKIAQAFALEVRYEAESQAAARRALDQRIDLSVSQAAVADVLAQVGAQAGLKISVKSGVIQVAPAP